MFMKHYAPNRCLYIKVAKLKTGVGSAEMSHLQNCNLKIYLKRALGVGLRGVRMDVNEELKFIFGGWGVGSGGGSDWGVRVDVNREVKFLRKLKTILWGGGGFGGGGVLVGGQVWGGGQGGCE